MHVIEDFKQHRSLSLLFSWHQASFSEEPLLILCFDFFQNTGTQYRDSALEMPTLHTKIRSYVLSSPL